MRILSGRGYPSVIKIEAAMRPDFLKHFIKLCCLIEREDGQDLVEYALLVALLLGVAAAAGGQLAAGLVSVYNGLIAAFSSAF